MAVASLFSTVSEPPTGDKGAPPMASRVTVERVLDSGEQVAMWTWALRTTTGRRIFFAVRDVEPAKKVGVTVCDICDHDVSVVGEETTCDDDDSVRSERSETGTKVERVAPQADVLASLLLVPATLTDGAASTRTLPEAVPRSPAMTGALPAPVGVGTGVLAV